MKLLNSFCLSILCCIVTLPATSQTQDVQQLQDQVQQLKQLTEELKARVATLEKAQAITQPAGNPAEVPSETDLPQKQQVVVTPRPWPARREAADASPLIGCGTAASG